MNFDSRFTQILESHPGYTWIWDFAINTWILQWTPIKGVYSPPLLDHRLYCKIIPIPIDLQNKIGLICGKDGRHFKKISECTFTPYIFYRHDYNSIEIWSFPIYIPIVESSLYNHFNYIRSNL